MAEAGLDALAHRIRPPASQAEGLLVLFHGRGAGESDLYPLLDVLDPEQRLIGVTPRGPLALPPGGAHWYAVRRVGYPDPETFRSTYHLAGAWLNALAGDLEVSPERVVLGGFSQGAVMSYALGLGADRPRPAAVIALSGFIPAVDGFELDLNRRLPPVAIGHGTYDPVISIDFARRARDLLANAGADVRLLESPMAHTIDPAFLGELAPWLRLIGRRWAGTRAAGP